MSSESDPPEEPDSAAATANAIELTILMPCLNEAETLESCIRKAQTFLTTHGVRGEVVVADNGSTDGSRQIAQRCGARVVEVSLRGYGAALYFGSKAARGKYIIMGDADDSYDFANLLPFVTKLREGFDLVMGNRFLGGIASGAMPWKNRVLGNPVLSGLGRLFFRCPAKDFHCGLRGYSAGAFERMDLRTTGMEFASEMVIKATLLRMRIAEVPTTLSPDGRSRPPHLRPWRDGWRHLRFMLLHNPRWLFFYPGMLLILLGSIGGAWLLSHAELAGKPVPDVPGLLCAAAAVVVGFQAVLFSVMSRIFAMNEGLLPPSRRIESLFRSLPLEAGLCLGAFLAALGIGGFLFAVVHGGRGELGPSDLMKAIRILIPSCAGMLLGSQIILASFFFSVLGLKVRRMRS